MASIGAADVVITGVRTIAVFDPATGLSNGVGLTVTAVNLVPTITSLAPASVVAGSAGLSLVVDGHGFVLGSVVRLDAVDYPTTFVSPTRLRAAIPASDLAREVMWAIAVQTESKPGRWDVERRNARRVGRRLLDAATRGRRLHRHGRIERGHGRIGRRRGRVERRDGRDGLTRRRRCRAKPRRQWMLGR